MKKQFLLIKRQPFPVQALSIAYSGEKTGRSPKDKRVVEHPDSKENVWWGSVNIPVEESVFETNLARAKDYINIKEKLYSHLMDMQVGMKPTESRSE